MDVNNLLVLCVVCLSFGLSTQFILDGFNGFFVQSLQCIGHTCEHHKNNGQHSKKRQFGSHIYCQIGHKNGIFTGHCGESESYHTICGLHEPTCRCYDQHCIDGFEERNRQHLELHQMTYTCLKHTCHGTEHCHIQEKDGEIESSCSKHEEKCKCYMKRNEICIEKQICSTIPNSQEMCLNHDSVTSSGGCYCNNADCVQNTALHCLGVNCKPTEGCRIDQHSGQFQARCYTLHKCDDDDDCIPRCHVPLILSHGHLPCHCDSQDCADNIQVPTTNTPSTTTVPALLQLDPYTCVADNCGKHEPYCNLHLVNNNIEGRCMILQAGQLCTHFNDLSVNGGCYCSDSKCVVNAITYYNHKHITVPTLAPEYLCDKASCRSDMFCQLFTYQGVATSRCLAFHTGTNCLSYKDVNEMGCICNNTNCAMNILAEYALNNKDTTTTSTTTESTTPPSTTTPSTTTLTTTPSKTTPSKTTPTTTPSTTTPTTTPTKTPTTTPTTITTVATTTTTTTRTTSISATTTGPRTCHVCGDTTLPVPCSSRQIGRDLSHTCKTGEHYCMTDIVQDDQGNVDVFKRCVDLATCEKKWITESADLDYCKRYGVVKNPYAFSCHFCCTQDKCNSMLVPNATTWYTKTN